MDCVYIYIYYIIHILYYIYNERPTFTHNSEDFSPRKLMSRRPSRVGFLPTLESESGSCLICSRHGCFEKRNSGGMATKGSQEQM